MTGTVHAMALRAPWYVCERGTFDRFDPRAHGPVIQKYDSDQFVARLVHDPSDSLAFDPDEDVWSFPVPRGSGGTPRTMRELLTPYRLARSKICKLYQPSHERFYALTVELFCDTAGLPRPGPADQAEVRFVVRRLRTTFKDPGVDGANLKELARFASAELFGQDFPDRPPPGTDVYPPADPTSDAAQDLAALYRLNGDDVTQQAAFEAAHAALIAKVGMEQVLEGWYATSGRPGGWRRVPELPGDAAPADPEVELPMWRVPGAVAGCDPARTRSLWFGVLPTYSGELDCQDRPKLDERTTYVVQCIARRRQPAPRQDCPPLVTTSGRSTPFRLAAFFDPMGTANRRVHVRLPDFAALAARAGAGPSRGGVEFERPAGSQLPAGPLGEVPDRPSGVPGGDAAETCSYAIELITIVATFVLSLFLPVVVFAFQLWWLLLLKFCWPPTKAVDDLLAALGTRPISALVDLPGSPDRTTFLEVLGVADDKRADLFEPAAAQLKQDRALGAQFVQALQPEKPVPAEAPEPLPPVTDPLCARSTATATGQS